MVFAGAVLEDVAARIGVTEEQLRSGGMGGIFAGAFALLFLAAAMFAVFLGPEPGLAFGAAAGFAAGLFWVAASFGVNYLFERRSFKLWLINGGYNVAAFTAIGAVIGALS